MNALHQNSMLYQSEQTKALHHTAPTKMLHHIAQTLHHTAPPKMLHHIAQTQPLHVQCSGKTAAPETTDEVAAPQSTHDAAVPQSTNDAAAPHSTDKAAAPQNKHTGFSRKHAQKDTLSQSTVKQKKMLHSLQTKTLHSSTDTKRNTLIPSTLAKTLTNPQSKMMCWTIQNKVDSSRNSAQAMQACTRRERNKKHLCSM